TGQFGEGCNGGETRCGGKRIVVEPIAYVRSTRSAPLDDQRGGGRAGDAPAGAYDAGGPGGIREVSPAEGLLHLHAVAETDVERGARHPRGNRAWPRVGIFAQRGKDRPNRLGSTIVRVVAREGRVLTVVGLDAIDGTPVLDVKPVMAEFLPREPVRQPAWAHELMREYW